MAARVRECLIDCARRFVLWGLPIRLAPDTLAAPVPGPQHFLMNHPEKREPVQVQRHRYKKQDVEGGVLSAALKLGNVNTRETSEISKFLLR